MFNSILMFRGRLHNIRCIHKHGKYIRQGNIPLLRETHTQYLHRVFSLLKVENIKDEYYACSFM